MSASATLISYTFNGTDGKIGKTVSYTESDITVIITALKSFGSSNRAANLHRHSNGLGVYGNPNRHRIGNNEALVFDWSPVSGTLLSGLIFENRGGTEYFDIYVDGLLVVDNLGISGAGESSSTINLDLSGYSLFGKTFTIVGQTGSGIRVRGLTLDVPTPTTSTLDVPTPTTLALFAISAIGLMLRRKA